MHTARAVVSFGQQQLGKHEDKTQERKELESFFLKKSKEQN